MSIQNTSFRRILRLVVIAALVSLSVGAIAYSACCVRYHVDGVPKTEFAITELSLLDCVQRTPDGKLTNPYSDDQSAAPSLIVSGTSSRNTGPSTGDVLIASAEYDSQWQQPATKKSPIKPAKKPGIKKPAPKKPAPNKPAPKKPKKPKACPT